MAYENRDPIPNEAFHSPVRLARWNNVTKKWEIEGFDPDSSSGASGVDLAYDPASGEPTVSYGSSVFGNRVVNTLNFARRDLSGHWSIEIIDDRTGQFNYTSLAYDPLGNPSISYRLWPYRKQKNPGLKFAYWDGSSWVLEMVDPGEMRRVGNSLVYDPATGEATIAYHRDDTLKFCRRDATTESWNIELVATGDHPWRGVSLVYDPEGNPSIAFHVISPDDPGDDILKFARWDGSSWVIEVVDTYASGEGNSLAYDADGVAYISYTGSGGKDYDRMVKLARRDPDTGWEIEIVTSCLAAGPTSLKFDPLGNPSVGYSNYTNHPNNQLKFARIAP
jgi:hypothetical protein